MKIKREDLKILRLSIKVFLISLVLFTYQAFALTYTVKKGDSLDKIARKYGVSVKEIIRENNLKKPYIIRPGQKLKIPDKKVKRIKATGYIKYKVKPGDSLIKIAKKFGVSTKEIIRLNNLKKPYHLRVGQVLKIPKKTKTGKKTPKIKAYKIYTVKPGDALSKIAKKFGVSVKELARVNNLKKPYRLRAGQKLKIPVYYTSKRKRKPKIKRTNGSYSYSYCVRRYRVRPGDSLIKIAKKFGTSAKKLKKINNLKSNTLRVGQVLCVKKVVKNIKRGGSYKVVKTKIIKYRVKPGDSLIKIAKKFRVYTKDIIRLNKLKKPYHLRVGQVLKIPKKVVSYVRREEEEYYTEINPKTSINFGFIWPLEGTVINKFVNNSMMRHLGIDISSNCGEPVVASESGKVIFAGNSIKAYGKLIVIKHKGRFNTIYGHLRDILVREGQYVRKGQTIGTAGNLDDTTCGIYFEIRKNTVPVDPLVFLSK